MLPLIPKPMDISLQGDGFVIQKTTRVFYDKQAFRTAELFAEILRKSTGYKIPLVENSENQKTNNGIHFLLSGNLNSLGAEGYKVNVDRNAVSVYASDVAGLFNGSQTLRQLLPASIESDVILKNEKWVIPGVNITDKPRFSWRGYMQDVSRTFYSVDVIKKYMDLMGLYKLNVLHFHLTDDQGWRIEIKKYPELTAHKSTVFAEKHNQPAERSGFYTQDQIKELVRYAKDRNITIVPEIDVPGHSWPTILAYPELGVNKKREPGQVFPFLASWGYWGNQFTPNTLDPTKEVVYEFLDGVFTEIAELFPGQYIHFGGDEVKHSFWEAEPHVKEFMTKNDLKTTADLQNYFVTRVSKIIRSKNKKPIGWNDILNDSENLTKETAIMSWLGAKAVKQAAGNGFYTVASPTSYLYFDITQSDRNDGTMSDLAYSNINSIEHLYGYDPTESLTSEEEKYVLGLQANQWTAIPQEVKDMNVQNFPRLFAVSEIGWIAKSEKRDFTDFEKRVNAALPRLDILKVDYFRKGGYITGTWTPKDIDLEYKPIEWDVTKKVYTEGRIIAGFFYTHGESFMNIRKAELLEDGKVISVDNHQGLADKFRGTNKTKTFLYNLKVDNYNPKAKYTLRAEVAGKEGTDSFGNFTFNLSPYKPFTKAEPK